MTPSTLTPMPSLAPLRQLGRWLMLALALIGALGVFGSSSAFARGDDDGQWQILHARYGTADRNIDVTGRLKELARKDRRFQVTNELFHNDPAYRQTKTLRIYARARNGENRTFEFREGTWLDGSDFTGWSRGDWGDSNWNGGWDGPRPGPGYGGGGDRQDDGQWQILQARYGYADRNIDVTARLKEVARRDARVRVTNDLFRDDPAVGRTKTLRIYARGPRGDQRTFEFREGDWIDGNQFTGWGRGDWGNGGWNGGWDGRPGAGNPPPPPPVDNRITIVRASYGTGRDWIDVTARLRNISRGGPVNIRVDNNIADRDPAVGRTKTLRVTYTVGRDERTVEAREGQQLRFP